MSTTEEQWWREQWRQQWEWQWRQRQRQWPRRQRQWWQLYLFDGPFEPEDL